MKVRVRQLSDGDAGIDETVARMIHLARRDSRSTVVKGIAKKFKRGADTERIRQAFMAVLTLVPYRHDPPNYEMVTAPKYLLGGAWHGGDCDDQTAALASLLLAMGFRVWIKVIAWRRYEFTHVYLLVDIPSQGIAIPLDTVMGEQGFGREKQPLIRSKEYAV